MTDLSDLARSATAWPFQEARALLDERLKGKAPDKGYVLFETGYGPSGLPHIGTFGEVARTTMVRRAFETLAPGIKTRLFAFSDDMDGLRKVPDNIPNQDLVRADLGKPLTRVADPFGTHSSFGAHNNARLCAFLDSYGFEYEFQSATDWYGSGRFDAMLLKMLEKYDEVMAVMLPTLGEERQATYSPFLPVCPETGVVLQVPVVERDLATGTIVYKREDGKTVATKVTGGAVKLQWKADWAGRWYALGVDYEMCGKDLIPSYQLSSKICRILGGEPPMNLTYELFLDDKGQKISKSKGNGLSMEDWLRYAPQESLALYMYNKPKAAKRLHFDVIPRAVDDYLTFREKFPSEEPAAQLNNPVWHIHHGKPPAPEAGISFGILLNLASVVNADDPKILWGFVSRYAPQASPEKTPFLAKLIDHAVTYYQDFVKPTKNYRAPSETETAALRDLADALRALPAATPAEELQNAVFEVGKKHGFAELRAWFGALYEVLLGQTQGPRMGSFIALYGKDETVGLIERVLKGENLAA